MTPAHSRGVQKALLALLAAVAVGLSLAATQAQAAAPSGFVGVNSYRDLKGFHADKLGGAEVPVFRMMIEQHKQIGHYEAFFDRAARNNIRILPILVGDSQKPPNTDRRRRAFSRFVKEVVNRYGPNGGFWRGKPYPESVRVKWLQIWNEPNLNKYWGGRPSTGDYGRLLVAASNAASEVNRGVRVVSGGVPEPCRGCGQRPLDFLRGMFAVRGVSSKIGAVAVHPYAPTPADVQNGVAAVRDTLADISRSANSKPIWVTEFGWGSAGSSRIGLGVNKEKQAQYLRETYSRLISKRSRYGVMGAIWFNLVDENADSSGDYWFEHTGLFEGAKEDDFDAKPAWGAMKCVTGKGPC